MKSDLPLNLLDVVHVNILLPNRQALLLQIGAEEGDDPPLGARVLKRQLELQ